MVITESQNVNMPFSCIIGFNGVSEECVCLNISPLETSDRIHYKWKVIWASYTPTLLEKIKAVP